MQSEINIHDVLRLLLSVHDPTANKEIINIMQSCDCISLMHSFIEMISNNALTRNSNNELHLLINFITRCIRFNLTKNKQVYNNNNKILIHIIKQIYTTCIIVSYDDIALTWLCDVFTLSLNKLSKNNTNIEHIATLNQLISEIAALTETNVNLQLKLLKAVINSNSINELTLTTIFTVLDSIYEHVECTSLEMYFDTLNRVVKRFHAYDICINKITQRYHQLVLSFISGNNCQQQQPMLMSLNVKATLFHLLCTIITKFNVVGAHNDKYIMLILTEISHIKISLKNNKQQLTQALSTHTNTHYVYLYSFITLLYVLTPGLALTAQDVISLSIEIIVPLIDIALSAYNAVNCSDNNEIIHYHFINNIYNTCTPVNAVKETKSNLLFTLSSFLKRMLTLYGRYLHQTICYYINTLSHNDNLYLYLLCLVRNTLISTQTTNEIVFPLLSDKLQTNINIQPHVTPLYNNVYFWLFIDNYFIYFYLQFNKETFHKLLQFVLNSVVNINVHNNQLGIIALANITKNLFSKKNNNNNVNALPLQEAPFLCSEMIKFYNTNITHIINTFVNVQNESAVTVFYTLILKVINKNIIAVGNGDDKCIEKLIYFIINHLSTKVNATITKCSTNKSKQHNDQQLIFTMFNLLKQLIIKNESYVNNNDNNNIETIMFTNVFDTLQYVNYISFENEIIDLMNTFIQCRKRISHINYITKLLPHINQLIRKENEFNKNVFQLLINIIQYITDEQKDIMFNDSSNSNNSSNSSHSNFIYKVYNRVLNSNSNYKETFMIKSFLLKLITTYNNITEPTITKILTTSFDALLKALISFNKQNITLILSTFNIELYQTIHNILYDICIIIYSFFSYAQDVMNAINRNNTFYAFVNAVNMFIENVRNYKWMNVTLGKMIIIGMINVVNRNYYHNDSWMLFNIAYEMMLVVHDIRITEIKAKEDVVRALRGGCKENDNDDSNDNGVTGDKGVNVNDDMKIVNEVNAIVDVAKFNGISNVIDEFECFKSCAEMLKEKYPNEYNGVFLASMKNNGSIERYNNILHTKKVKIELNTIDINNNDKYIYIPRRIVTFKRNNMNIDVST